MKNDMLEVFSCLEDHLGWRVRVNYYTQSLSSFCQKTRVFSLVDVKVGEAIKVLSDNIEMDLEFFGPNSFIKTLEVSCQEGFYIKIYENKKLDLIELNSLIDVTGYSLSLKNCVLGNDFISFYREFLVQKRKSLIRFNDLVGTDTLFSKRAKVYLFSNEPLKEMFSDRKFFDDEDLSGKSVFSIMASGDFFLNACLLGCKDLTLVDINEYSFYYFEIKKAMIKKYNYQEFIDMYKNLTDICYKFEEYGSFIRDDIKKKIKVKFSLYGDEVFAFIRYVSWSDSFQFNTNNMKRRIDFFSDHNLYLSSEDDYNKLRNILLKDNIKLNMSVSSLFDIDFLDMKSYDYIYLSNVLDYCDVFQSYEFLQKLKDKFLNEKGKIILVYRTDKYKYLLDKGFGNITMYKTSFNTSMDNVVLYCSFD